MKIKLNHDIFQSLKKENLEKNRKKILLSICMICIFVFFYLFFHFNQILAVYQSDKSKIPNTDNMKFVVGGEAIGIKLLATGVLVMGIDREDSQLQVGDIILKVNGQKIETNIELLQHAKKSQGKDLQLEVSRDDKIFHTKLVPILDEISQEYKLGLWVKDSSAGVGTITFYEKNTNRFVALGHGVTETKENYILPIESGGITKTNIYSIKKGVPKVPGELKGTIHQEAIGDIKFNTDKGIYGNLVDENSLQKEKEVEALAKGKIKEGNATILCTLDDNKVKEYQIEIQKVLLNSQGNKNMIIKITDQELLSKTGGIVQGMSGSPIMQNGKLVGAVTHVFLSDPTRGYGVFVENLIEDMNRMK